jgi:Undecaprenyl-phosphate galactose phosphotransferase WbaP
VYPTKHIERVSSLALTERTRAYSGKATATRRLRAWLCPVSLLTGDLLAFIVAALLAFAVDVAPDAPPYTRAMENLTTLGAQWHGWGTALVLVSLLGYFGGRGHYTSRVPSWTQLSDVVGATAVALACDIFLTIAIYQRTVQVEGLLRWILFCPSLLLVRVATRGALRAVGLWSLQTLIVASSDEIDAARAALMSDASLGYRLVGTVTPDAVASLPDDELIDMVAARRADFVVVAVGGGEREAEHAALDALRRTGLPIAIVPALRGLPVVGFRQHYFLGHDIVMLVSSVNLTRPLSRVLKLLFDQIAATILLLLMTPLLLTLIIIVRADGGPAFYRHRRIGAGGRVFDCIKFRSMVVDADRVLRRVLATDRAAAKEWAATQKLRDDPRVTPIGRFLRRSSLDELPQLFNVLRGEMSLVGPRPIVHAEVAKYGTDIEHYYAAKPGITGLWQVSGRSEMSYVRRVQLDAWYVRNWTLWHDIAILFKTIPAVFLQRGAH